MTEDPYEFARMDLAVEYDLPKDSTWDDIYEEFKRRRPQRPIYIFFLICVIIIITALASIVFWLYEITVYIALLLPAYFFACSAIHHITEKVKNAILIHVLILLIAAIAVYMYHIFPLFAFILSTIMTLLSVGFVIFLFVGLADEETIRLILNVRPIVERAVKDGYLDERELEPFKEE